MRLTVTDTHHVDHAESSRTQSVTAPLANGTMVSSVASVLQDALLVTLTETVQGVKTDFSDGLTMMVVGTSVHSDTAYLLIYVLHGLQITMCMSSYLLHVKTACKFGNHVMTIIITLSEYTEVRQNPLTPTSGEVSRNHSSSKIVEPGSTVNTI